MCPAHENYKLNTFICLKTKFKTNKVTRGNAFITDLSKNYLCLKILVRFGEKKWGREGGRGGLNKVGYAAKMLDKKAVAISKT